jgi:hypothetical protein
MWFSHAKDRLRHLDPLAPSFCEAGAGQPFAITVVSGQWSVKSKFLFVLTDHRPLTTDH